MRVICCYGSSSQSQVESPVFDWYMTTLPAIRGSVQQWPKLVNSTIILDTHFRVNHDFGVLVNLSFQTNQADLLTPFRNPPTWISGNASSTGFYASIQIVRTFDWVSPTDAVASSKRSLARRSAIRMGRSTPDLPDAPSGSPWVCLGVGGEGG